MSVVTLGSTTRTTSPPRPPAPPSGPPSGLNFSRWIEAQLCPPSPAVACRTTRSTNTRSGVHWDDAHRAPAAPAVEPHRAGRQREQRVVAAPAHLLARVEVRSAL